MALSIVGLSKTYPNGVRALDELTHLAVLKGITAAGERKEMVMDVTVQ